jgi:hypothetical protein
MHYIFLKRKKKDIEKMRLYFILAFIYATFMVWPGANNQLDYNTVLQQKHAHDIQKINNRQLNLQSENVKNNINKRHFHLFKINVTVGALDC